MGWMITLGILFLLAILPLGVSVRYNAQGPLVRLILGPVHLTVVPAKKKGTQKKKEDKPKKTKKKEPPVKTIGADKPGPVPGENPQEKKEEGGSWTDFLPLVKVALDFLGDFRRKLRVNVLELKLILAGGDPCKLGMNYGRAWAAVGNLMPRLERIFVIKKRDVEVECDFTASETKVIARLDLTITLGRLLAAVFSFAIRALVQFIKIKKSQKGGATQ